MLICLLIIVKEFTMKKICFIVCFLLAAFFQDIYAQRIGYINSATIREKYPEARNAEQRLESIVNDWKREMDEMQRAIDNLSEEIVKNRLIWTDKERQDKERELVQKKEARQAFANKKFGPGGEYDATIPLVTKGVEEKIYAAVQEVCFEESFDIVWDKSSQPLAFINPKYDLTVKVMRKLGIDVDKLEEEQQKAIDSDPRNKKKPAEERPQAKRRRSRTTETEETTTPTDTEKKDSATPETEKTIEKNE